MNQLLNGDRYRLKDELGRGGMGRVYRAVDSVLDRDVVVWLCYQESTLEFQSH